MYGRLDSPFSPLEVLVEPAIHVYSFFATLDILPFLLAFQQIDIQSTTGHKL